jgi:hypothetical protein
MLGAGLRSVARGVDLATVALMPRTVLDEQPNGWVVECRETHLRDLVAYLGCKHVADAIFVLHPERKRVMRALRLAVPDPAALPTSDLEGWLSRHAPHIHRIG